MTDAMNILFQFAQERLVTPQFIAEPEYENAKKYANEQEAHLRSLLNDEARQCLDAFLDERGLLRFFEDEALFRAGFKIAIELSR